MDFPEIMQTPFEPPIPVKDGNGLPTVIRSPAEAYIAFDGWVPATLHWDLVGSCLGAMRRGQMTDVAQIRRIVEGALFIDGMLDGPQQPYVPELRARK